jgi:LysM repeat protein
MPERKPNQLARMVAVVALVAASVLVAFTIFTSEGDSGSGENGAGGSGGELTQVSEPTSEGQKALDRGFYVVKDGDTLAQIAQDTGLELDTVSELNPELDPQALIAGERVTLP